MPRVYTDIPSPPLCSSVLKLAVVSDIQELMEIHLFSFSTDSRIYSVSSGLSFLA